jgi:hypothetical protein
MRKTIPLIDRLLRRIEIVPESGCWIWMGSVDKYGYGRMSSKFGQSPLKTYRVSYELFVGEIPNGFLVRHKCDIPSCVNPYHLEIGTQKDNARDTSKRGRLNPVSLLNLRPGESGVYGAGTKSNKELGRYVSK